MVQRKRILHPHRKFSIRILQEHQDRPESTFKLVPRLKWQDFGNNEQRAHNLMQGTRVKHGGGSVVLQPKAWEAFHRYSMMHIKLDGGWLMGKGPNLKTHDGQPQTSMLNVCHGPHTLLTENP